MIAVATPFVVSAIADFSEKCDLDGVNEQARTIIGSAERVWYAGAGSSEDISIDIEAGYTVRLGGIGADQWSYSILSGDDVLEKNYLDSPKIRFVSCTDVSGHCSLRVACTNQDGYGIMVVPV